jgi:dGTPase
MAYKNWYLTEQRLIPTSVEQKRDLELEYLSDYGRIVTSSALRRLQAKAQVFSLEENAAVRSRLTHSMEVSSIGNLLATMVCRELITKKFIQVKYGPAFVSIVRNACLIHDIGNPPFGHYGEHAIKDWFKNKRAQFTNLFRQQGYINGEFDKYFSDFINFDGNSQGFRIITRLQWHHHDYGLNLTCSLLAASLKYLGNKPEPEKGPLYKKAGHFYSEQPLVLAIKKKLDFDICQRRHPISYLVEAADDLSYCLSDIEDGIEKNILTCDDVVEQIINNVDKKSNKIKKIIRLFYDEIDKKRSTNTVSNNFRFTHYKILLTQYLIEETVKTFIEKVDIFMSGYAKPLIKYNSTIFNLLEVNLQLSRDRLYQHKAAIDVELHGNSILHGLLDSFSVLFNLSDSQFLKLDASHPDYKNVREFELEKRLFTLLPKKHLLEYKRANEKRIYPELYNRIHLVVDYISGMTDSHALKVFKLLQGIELTIR